MNKYRLASILGVFGILLLGCTMPKQDFSLVPPGYVAIEVGGPDLLNPASGLEINQITVKQIETVEKEIRELIGDKYWIETDGDGHALLAFSLDTPAGSSDRNGVWVSRDWQDETQAKHIDNAVWAKFCSAGFVWIGLQDESYLLDLEKPGHQFPVDSQLIELQVASNRKWIGTDEKGKVFIGTLDFGVSIAHASPISIERDATSARLLPGGNYVAFLIQGKVCVIDSNSGERLGCVPGIPANIEFETDSMLIKTAEGYLNAFDIRDNTRITKRDGDALNSIPLLLWLTQRDYIETARPTLTSMRNLASSAPRTNLPSVSAPSYTMLLRLQVKE